MDNQESKEDVSQPRCGRDVNFLVRSKVAKRQTLSKAATRNPNSCIRKLEILKEVELLQNIQVQRSLRFLMDGLSEKRVGDLESARSYLEAKRKAKCHDNVVKIRKELKESLRSMDSSCKPFNRRFTDSELYKQAKVTGNSSGKMSDFSGNAKIKNVFADCFIPSTYKNDRKSHSRKQDAPKLEVKSRTSLPALSASPRETKLHQESFDITLPQIVKNFHSTNQNSSKSHFQYCLPVLDSNSKFSIIKMARTLRQKRHDIEEKSRAKPEAKRNLSLEEKTIDLFGDNFDLLSPQYLVKEKKNDQTMELLDSECFDDIDCDDFLHLKNRIVNVSPVPMVLTSRKKDKN